MKKSLLSAVCGILTVLMLSLVLSVSVTTSADAALTCTKCYTSCANGCSRTSKAGCSAGTGDCPASCCVNKDGCTSGSMNSNVSCSVSNGSGLRPCVPYNGCYLASPTYCNATSCNSGYTPSGSECVSCRSCSSGSWGSSCTISCSSGYHSVGGQYYTPCDSYGNGCASYGSTYCSGATCVPNCTSNCSYAGQTGSQSCSIANGSGTQSRTCNNGGDGCVYWGGWGSCTVNGCNSGYHKDGNSCVSNTTSCPAGWTGNVTWSGSWNSGSWNYSACTKSCSGGTISHGTTTPVNSTINCNAANCSVVCTYDATCDTGYSPSGNGTASPSCVANTYTINFDGNTSFGLAPTTGTTSPTTCTFDQSCALRANNFNKNGYVFSGWALTQAGANDRIADFPNLGPVMNLLTSGSLTLYAVWLRNPIVCPAGTVVKCNGDVAECTPCPADTICPGGTYEDKCPDCATEPDAPGCSDCLSSPTPDGCLISSCSSIGDGSFALSGAASSLPEHCYKITSCYPSSAVNAFAPDPATGTEHYSLDNDTCEYTVTNCATNRFKNPSMSSVCSGINSDCSCSLCPDGGLAPNANSGNATTCYKVCPSVIPISNVATIERDQTNVYFSSPDGTGGVYQTCTYDITCAPGYTVANNHTATPSCVANTFTFTFLGNNHTGGTMSVLTCTFDQGCNLTTNEFVRNGYEFTGWSDVSTSRTVILTDGQDVGNFTSTTGNADDNGHNYNLYATWNSCSAGYYWNGSACTSCPRGTYKGSISESDGAAQQCEICPAGTTTADTANTSVGACTVQCSTQITDGASVTLWGEPTWPDLVASSDIDTLCPITNCEQGWKKVGNLCVICTPTDGDALYDLNTCTILQCGQDGYLISRGNPPTVDDMCQICPPNEWSVGPNANTECVSHCDAGFWHESGSTNNLTEIGLADQNAGHCSTDESCSLQTCHNWFDKGSAHCNPETCIVDQCKTGYHLEGTGTDTICAPNIYTIFLNKSGSSGSVVESIQCTFDDENCLLPGNGALQKDGHTNKGQWCKSITPPECTPGNPSCTSIGVNCFDAGAIETSNLSPDGTNITMYAFFQESQLVITLEPNNGMNPGDIAGTLTTYLRYSMGFSLTSGSGYVARPTITVPTRRGYTFMGYRTGDNCSGDLIIAQNGQFENNLTTFTPNDTTIYACWEANVYKYTLDDNGGNIGPVTIYVKYDTGWSHSPTGPFSDRITIVPPTRTNYKFTGFYYNLSLPGQIQIIPADGNVTGNLDFTDQDVTLLAGWSYRDYAIRFNSNGGNDGAPMDEKECTFSQPCTLPANLFKKNGYIFGGWASSSANATDGIIARNDQETFDFLEGMDITYYAIWYYNARFAANGATGAANPLIQKCYHNNYCYMADQGTLAKAKYTFDGWSTANDGTGIVVAAWDAVPSSTYDSYLTADGYLNLYARWKHSLTFDGNSQTTSSGTVPARLDCFFNASCVLPDAGMMEKTGYLFDGWNRQPDGSGPNFGAGTAYDHTPDSSANNALFARWKYKLVYDGNQAITGGVPPAVNLFYGQTTVVPDNIGNLTRGGRIFDGWDKLPDPSSTATSIAIGSVISNVPDMPFAQITDENTVTLFARWFGCDPGYWNDGQDRICHPTGPGYETDGCDANGEFCTGKKLCPHGTYASSNANKECVKSDEGNHTTDCIDTTNWLGCTAQTKCEAGTYSDEKGAGKTCKDPGPGNHTSDCDSSGMGCKSKDLCESGTYASGNNTDRFCESSEKGHHTDNCLDTINWLGCREQTPCEPGTYSDVRGAAQFCKDSGPGYHTDGDCDTFGFGCTTKTMCETGTFSNNQQQDRTCTQSQPGNHTNNCIDEINWLGCREQTPCEPGTYAPTTGSAQTCLDSGAGHHTAGNCDADGYGCTSRELCEYGTWSNDAQRDRSCSATDPGYHTENCINTTDWIGCRAQTICPAGTYSSGTGAGATCVQSQPGHHTDDCVDPVNWLGCRIQTPCEPGTYAPTAGSAQTCLDSGSGYHTDGNCDADGYGCTSRELCEYGTWSNDAQQDRICPESNPGYHTDDCIDTDTWTGCRAQTMCPLGTYSSGTGAGETCTQSQPGNHTDDCIDPVNWLGCRIQTPCEPGTYAPTTGSAQTCLDSGSGYHTDGNCDADGYGCTSRELCEYGTWSNDAQRDRICPESNPGYHTDDCIDTDTWTGCRAQTMCPLGTYSSGTGAGKTCTDVPEGAYNQGEGNSGYTVCAEGAYNTGMGNHDDTDVGGSNIGCIACPAGTTTDGGQTQNPVLHAGASACSKACDVYGMINLGYIASYNETWWDVTTNTVHSINGANLRDAICTVKTCIAGSYRQNDTACTACAPGSFTAVENYSTTCTLCAKGSFNNSPLSTSCTACMETPEDWAGTFGATTVGLGATSCDTDCGNVIPSLKTQPGGIIDSTIVETWLGSIWSSTGSTAATSVNTLTNDCSIIDCRAGAYYKNGECWLCNTGSYSVSSGSLECIACQSTPGNWGLTTSGPGQVFCNATCGKHNVETWLDTLWEDLGLNNNVPNVCGVEQCSAGHYYSGGENGSGNCDGKCKAGYYCPIGSLDEKGTTPNPHCDANMDDCPPYSGEHKCKSGWISAAGAWYCEQCPVGSISSPDAIPGGQTVVPAEDEVPGYADVTGIITQTPGSPSTPSASNTQCWYCGAGLIPNADHSACVKCPSQTFKSSDNNTSEVCTPCPPNSNCLQEGLEEPVCLPGFVLEKSFIGKYTCEPIEVPCTIGESGYGTQDRKGNCILIGCLGDNHISPDGTHCEPNVVPCETPGGKGFREWDSVTQTYGACIETECKTGYQKVNGVCEACNLERAVSYMPGAGCIISQCENGFHVNPTGTSCDANTIDCEVPHAISAVRYWENNQYGVCVPLECEVGYHIASNACVADTQGCLIENGTGIQTWLGTSSDGGWSECAVASCNAGYTNDPTETNEPSKPCGPCRNRYGLLGEIAVSSYVGGCEIASCMYQGEVYNLDNNECVPLCDIHGHDDNTGSVVWDPNAHRCVRTCNEGYSLW